MGALCSKTQPRGARRAPAQLGNRQHRLSQPEGGRLCSTNAGSSSLAAERRFWTHLDQSRTGIPSGAGAFMTLLLSGVTYTLQFLMAPKSGLWTRGRSLRTDRDTKKKPCPQNIISVTAAPLTRAFLARFSDLKDTLGKISSYDKVILSLLCCSCYTSP